MLLVSTGMAGHAAQFKGESSPRDSPNFEHNSIPRHARQSLIRSTFSPQLPRRATTYEPYTPKVAQRPPYPRRPVSEYIPRAHEPTVRFQEPETDRMSEDCSRSVANSESSETTGGKSRRRRSLRPSTAFHLAHPAPTLTQKQRLLLIRPKLLFQLQMLSADSRPRPAIDVLPSTVVVPRLVKKFPRMFKGKGQLGANDIMVVKSEDYDAPDDQIVEEHESDGEGLANRHLLAVICQMRKECGGSEGKAEIVLNDGRWVATPLPNNSFDFVSKDERGTETIARWAKVKKGTARKSLDLYDGFANDEVKFTFSILDPHSRRHPIIATLTQAKLDIPNSYTTSSSANRPPLVRGVPGQPIDNEPITERTTHIVDENLKTLIQVTAIWVALRQGWCSYFKYSDGLAAATTSTNAASGGRVRSMSLTPDGLRPGATVTRASTPDSMSGGFGSVGNKIRQTCITRGSPASGISSQIENAGTPQRSISAGTAFMQRAAARRTGNAGISTVVASDNEDEAEDHPNPPRRAATEKLLRSGSQMTTPPLALPGSSTTTPDTPTRPQRRPHSVYVPTSLRKNAYTNGHSTRHSMDVNPKQPPETIDVARKPKAGRWKAFTSLFRRLNHTHND
ncbi:hypothetical protein LHYA1_G006843 [Lachnellula hyalina]|uniref:Uncharacterized protein n=1 Tax=Lachnellula hyalina TaxID=1316788 RepID=A0A8H8QYD9_9HELO|nr:uncharacterized protein LHYA1_G006843 [Lachnellula hyalina]TVY24781.1 hypothetical protein LHYA1_G006843 [Lachnellula hyalina]